MLWRGISIHCWFVITSDIFYAIAGDHHHEMQGIHEEMFTAHV